MSDLTTAWAYNTDAYKNLKAQIETDPDFVVSLELSLEVAGLRARTELKPELYLALDNVFGGDGQGWPTTSEAYLAYIAKYLVLIPNEQNDPGLPNAWKNNGQQNGYNQKVYDLLCQFYLLVDQPLYGNGGTLQDYTNGEFVFADWLRTFATDWGIFLDHPLSLTPTTKASFFAASMYNMDWYKDNAGSWTTFNEFFYRQFNHADERGQSPLRPIAEPRSNNAIVSSADCTYIMKYPIYEEGRVLGLNGKPTSVTLKNTHEVFTIAELLQDEELAEHFKGGTFVHYFLSPFDYHRFHSPISGRVKECRHVQGNVYLDVDLGKGEFHAPDSAVGGYEFNQSRGVFVVDSEGPEGLVASVPIGMAQVSGVDMRDLTGKYVAKGDEFGKFKFGGSDTILLFQRNPDLYLFEKDPSHVPIHFQYGQVAAYWNVNEQR